MVFNIHQLDDDVNKLSQEASMAKMSPETEQQLRENPDQIVDLIVRTDGDATPHLKWLASAGFQVKQQFRLSPGVAGSCSGQDALKIAAQAWVVSIELDAPVQTMGS